MFKKTLLCAAIVAVSGGAVAKATGVATTLIQSTEGSMDILTIPTASVAYDLGASYVQGDTVTLTWSQPLAAGVGHTSLAIKDQVTQTFAAANNAYVTAMNATAELTVTDHLGQTVTLNGTAVAAATTAGGLATLINNATGAFSMTASGTDGGGVVLTEDVGSGTGLATLTPAAAYTGATFTFVKNTPKEIPLTVLSNTASSVTYRAGAVPAAFNYGGAMGIATDAKNILGSGQADGTVVTQTYTAATSTGIAIDTGTVAVGVAEFHDQFRLVATKTAKQVDVENLRKQFVGADDAAKTTDTVGISISEDLVYAARVSAAGTVAGTMVGTLNSAAPKSTAKINGNYSWLDKAATAAYDIDATKGSIAPGFVATTHFADSVTINPVAEGTAVTVAVTTAKTAVLPTGAYTADVTMKYKNAASTPVQKTKVFATVSLGAWTLNGSTITAYGIPNQAAVTPFLWIQNAGATAGEISGTASCDGATIQLGSLGTASGDTNTTVGALVQAAVDAAGTCAVGSRYDATLTVNAKSTDITVTSGYKVTASDGSNDRLSLETSDSLN